MHARKLSFKLSQLMVMRSEQCLCAEQLRIRHMLNHRPGDRKTVERTRSSSDLIENQQTVRGCIPKNICHLRHLNHKRTLAACQVIGCADTGKDPVHNTDVCLRSRNKRTDLCHQHNEGRLAHIRRFTGHVRSGDDGNAVVTVVKQGIVCDKHIVWNHLLDHWVTAVLDINLSAAVQLRTHIVVVLGNVGK